MRLSRETGSFKALDTPGVSTMGAQCWKTGASGGIFHVSPRA